MVSNNKTKQLLFNCFTPTNSRAAILSFLVFQGIQSRSCSFKVTNALIRFSELREYCEEEIRVLGFPHHKCWKDFFDISDGENSILTYILDLTILFTNTQKPCQMTANCIKIREVFTTTCDDIDFYRSICSSIVVFNKKNHWNFVDTGRLSCKLHNQIDIIKSIASTPYNLIKPSVSPPYIIWLMLGKIQKQFSKCI